MKQENVNFYLENQILLLGNLKKKKNKEMEGIYDAHSLKISILKEIYRCNIDLWVAIV